MKQCTTRNVFHSVRRTMVAAALIGGCSTTVQAGALEEAVTNGKSALDLRFRFETVDQGGITEKATASTLRTRLNYRTAAYRDLSGFIEFDDVTAVGVSDYNNATGLSDAKTAYPVVADPEGTEINQASLTYSGAADTTVTLGRQRIILDNARFIGNVGWRQNEQTYDALAVVNHSLDDTTIVYDYVVNVNRIFGEASAKGDIDTRSHLLNIAYDGFGVGKLTAYGYFLELPDTPTASNATIGARFKGSTSVSETFKALYTVEYASQGDYVDGTGIDASYSLLEAGAKVRGVTAKVGMETLGANTSAFATPLATAHAFNGWADKFLSTPANGLQDSYFSVMTKAAGIKLLGVYHSYAADQGGASYGDEIDLLAAKKFGRYSALFKYASYQADGHATDTDKLWLMGQASF